MSVAQWILRLNLIYFGINKFTSQRGEQDLRFIDQDWGLGGIGIGLKGWDQTKDES